MRYRHKGVVVSVDQSDPDVIHLDRDADTLLVQIDPDTYWLIRGRAVLGQISYVRGQTKGWRFDPRAAQCGSSRRLHPYPEAALGRRFVVQRTESLREIPA